MNRDTRNDADCKIEVDFKVSSRDDFLGFIFLEINFKYAAMPENVTITEKLHRPQIFYRDGVLTAESLYGKFNRGEISGVAHGIQYIYQVEKTYLAITYDLPKSEPDYPLMVLSIVNDAICVLRHNNVKLDFNLLDILKKIDEEYKKNENYQSAVMIRQLIKVMSDYPTLSHEDAIALFHCFNAFESFDFASLEIPRDLTGMMDNLISIVDKRFTETFLKETVHNELNEFMDRIFLWQRIKLYSPCLGKLVGDGDTYQWHDTEWDFLRDMKCKVNKNQNVYTLVSKENIGYANNYAYGKVNYHIFGKELVDIGKHINLSFAEKLDWHQKIIFTPECSKFLCDLKLHVDIDTVKAMIKSKNNYRLFQQARNSGDFKHWPAEITKLVYTLALGPLFSMEELAARKCSVMTIQNS